VTTGDAELLDQALRRDGAEVARLLSYASLDCYYWAKTGGE
jgi:hypothetical protein